MKKQIAIVFAAAAMAFAAGPQTFTGIITDSTFHVLLRLGVPVSSPASVSPGRDHR
jgi:hypothetical protein